MTLAVLFLVSALAGDPGRPYHDVAVADFATKRLTHVCTTGRVTLVKHEADGDLHLRVSDGKRFIVAEAIPTLPVQWADGTPKVGQTWTVCGIRRYDDAPGHMWHEIHPIEKAWPRLK